MTVPGRPKRAFSDKSDRHQPGLEEATMTVTREQRVAETFVELADTLVDDFDVIDFLHTLARRSTELLAVDAAGIMLADAHGVLRVAASSMDEARLVELSELQNDEGPCLDSFRTGQPVVNE